MAHVSLVLCVKGPKHILLVSINTKAIANQPKITGFGSLTRRHDVNRDKATLIKYS